MVTIRHVKSEDLPQLLTIENLCFTKEEAASREAFENRVERIPDTFYVAEKNGDLLGFVHGPILDTPYITDDLFVEVKSNPAVGGYQSILGLAVHPLAQKQGLASKLLTYLKTEAKLKHRQMMTLTCKEPLIGFYERHGYNNHGVSNSQHGGEKWYNMLQSLS